ncbi:DUF485 domain-containing protein [Haloactinospora alba]
MHDDPRFVTLRRRLRAFVFPVSIAFFSWYLLYVLMSAFARDVMSTVVFGNVNVALVFGLLQFVTTFGVAILYSRYANRRLDPLANELRAELVNETGTASPPQEETPPSAEGPDDTTRAGKEGPGQ